MRQRPAHRLRWIRRGRSPIRVIDHDPRLWILGGGLVFGGMVHGAIELSRGRHVALSAAMLVGGLLIVALFAAYVARPKRDPAKIRAARRRRRD